MAGTKKGAAKAAATKAKKYGPDYHRVRAAHAGKFSTHRPFKDPNFAKIASMKGVEARRKKALDKQVNHDHND